MSAGEMRTPATYRLRRYWMPSAIGAFAMATAGALGFGTWIIDCALTVRMFGSWALLGPAYERWSHIGPPPKSKITKRETAERLAVMGGFPLSLVCAFWVMSRGEGSPRLTVAFFYGVVLVDGALFWAVARRWRRRDSLR
jgi:hypothetical protein